MNKNNKLQARKNTILKKTEEKSTPILGRKRDPALDASILEAAINTLAEMGFDKMTMDMVAGRAKAGKATVYRRWASKGELVRDALIWMSQSSVEMQKVPDTGNLRADLLLLMKPYSAEQAQRKMSVMAGLGSFFTEHQKLADEALDKIYGPWTEMNLKLMKNAIKRGEVSREADIELACDVIIAMTSYRVQIQRGTFTKRDYEELLDKIVLPALKK